MHHENKRFQTHDDTCCSKLFQVEKKERKLAHRRKFLSVYELGSCTEAKHKINGDYIKCDSIIGPLWVWSTVCISVFFMWRLRFLRSCFSQFAKVTGAEFTCADTAEHFGGLPTRKRIHCNISADLNDLWRRCCVDKISMLQRSKSLDLSVPINCTNTMKEEPVIVYKTPNRCI